MNDPLPEGDGGGGGTTALLGSGTLPVARRRMSDVTSVDGGGATTAGLGKFNFGLWRLARSGAETGGGTIDAFEIGHDGALTRIGTVTGLPPGIEGIAST